MYGLLDLLINMKVVEKLMLCRALLTQMKNGFILFLVETEPKRFLCNQHHWFNCSKENISCRKVKGHLQLSKSKTILKTPSKTT